MITPTALTALDIELKINPLGIPKLLSTNFSHKNARVKEAGLLQKKG